MPAEKHKQARIYLPKDEADLLKSLSAKLGQSEAWVATTLFHAALAAVAKKGRIELPLQFAVDAQPSPKTKAA